MRGRFYWCKMGQCVAEIVWREDRQPICFWGKSGNGNVCEEPDDNFVKIPGEPILWYGCLLFHRLKRVFRKEGGK